MLELALVTPLLIMIGMGVAEYSYFMFAKSSIQEAAQAGAQAAIGGSATDASVRAAVDTAMARQGLQSVGYTVTTVPASVATVATGTSIRVTVSCSWGNFNVRMLPTSMGGIGTGKQVSGTALMARE